MSRMPPPLDRLPSGSSTNMAGWISWFQFFSLILACLISHATSNQTKQAYVVYMGSNSDNRNLEDLQAAHLELLSSIIPSEEKERVSLIQTYHDAFKGFSAMHTEKEAVVLSGRDGVVSVFRDHSLQLHTTRSWDFLEAESGIGSKRAHRQGSGDVIIGIVNTGTAKGGAPSSRLAMYKACSLGGCASSTVLKAIDGAICDGVDIISISIGMRSIFQLDFHSDPISIGAFHAQHRGTMVVCSGGNDGPDPYTVVNSAPWIATVAASSIDRTFESTIALGNGNVLKGIAINFSNLTLSKSYPLVFGGDAAADSTPVSEARSLDEEKTAGRILVCVDTDPSVTRHIKKFVAECARAKGLILVVEADRGVPVDSGIFPFSEVGKKSAFRPLPQTALGVNSFGMLSWRKCLTRICHGYIQNIVDTSRHLHARQC